MNNTQNEKQLVDRLMELGGNFKIVSAAQTGEPIAFVPSGIKVESLAEYCPPTRIKQRPHFNEAGSFSEYVNRFKTENTLIFVNFGAPGDDQVEFIAELDYHSKAPELKPAYCSHSATFGAVFTPEWMTWREANRRRMGQVEFAEWLEDNQKLFVEPSGADLLELVRSLHGHQNARFNTAIRLDNGAQSISYDEDVEIRGSLTTKSEKMQLPPQVKAGIAVFQGAPAYEVNARLKCRVEDRRLFLYYETISMHAIVRESIMLLAKDIAGKTGIVPLVGNP